MERLSDRQETISNLSCKDKFSAKVRLLFIGKLTESMKEKLANREKINENVVKAEKESMEANEKIIEVESSLYEKRKEIKARGKAVTSNAADLYHQVLRIGKDHKELISQNKFDIDLKIKNGKYPLIPLLRAGRFRSFGTQLAYQAKKITHERQFVSDVRIEI
ncbi:MAG: hypothetical protein ACI802_002051 [Candidatus Paceibacteria bacterium]